MACMMNSPGLAHPDQPNSSTGNNPHGPRSFTDAYSALPDVRAVEDTPYPMGNLVVSNGLE